MAEKPVKRMTKKEIKDWDALYQYVRKNVLKYSDDLRLPTYMTLRLKGMTEGKFMVNNNTKEMASYSYELILLTFKFCSLDIQRALSEIEFKDEKHKFNCIMRIIDDNINDVYLRLKRKEEVQREIDKEIEKAQENPVVRTKFEHKQKDKNKKAKDMFADYW